MKIFYLDEPNSFRNIIMFVMINMIVFALYIAIKELLKLKNSIYKDTKVYKTSKGSNDESSHECYKETLSLPGGKFTIVISDYK